MVECRASRKGRCSDQEPAVASIVEDVGRRRDSLVGSSASNGVVERAIQSLQQQIWVSKLALEDKWKMKIPLKHSDVPWFIEYSAFLMNRFELHHDGKRRTSD